MQEMFKQTKSLLVWELKRYNQESLSIQEHIRVNTQRSTSSIANQYLFGTGNWMQILVKNLSIFEKIYSIQGHKDGGEWESGIKFFNGPLITSCWNLEDIIIRKIKK